MLLQKIPSPSPFFSMMCIGLQRDGVNFVNGNEAAFRSVQNLILYILKQRLIYSDASSHLIGVTNLRGGVSDIGFQL